ncbi:LamG-like jellyroll fold domain-containing protein [Haloferula sp. BvORR071]|uniref:LamG-like jellyroll fold domain-containing protein n=1 Tax=Haloferula sp. BvORR071 TaxID=1396141 RepID=UPI000552941F|nr:LamG-like jellyroll fold domain-containing protein [Haloferula sp. BvORR071]
MPRPAPFILLRCGLAWIFLSIPERASAEDFAAYLSDPQTLHLWHLDEDSAPFADSAPDNPLPLEGLLNNAKAGLPSLPGFASAVSFLGNAGGTPGASDFHGAILAAARELANGKQDNVPANFRYAGPNGAFTYEMIVRPDMWPKDAPVVALGLLSLDGDANDRMFNFRIEKQSFLAFIALPDSGASGGALASIPGSGPNALQAGAWYHIAVTYDGNAGVANNMKLYWTRLDGTHPVEANLIGRGSLSGDLNGKSGDLAIGNEARSFEGNGEAEPFPGLIDEVRISGVARNPHDFFFVPPAQRIASDPSTKPVDAKEQGPMDLKLSSVLVDASPAALPKVPGEALRLGSGLHRLDFAFGFDPGRFTSDVELRCQLEGIDERWQETELGMSLVCQALDSGNHVISQSSFPAMGRSPGWETTMGDSKLTHRTEPVYFPPQTAALRITLGSGSPDTTGLMMVDDIALLEPGSGKSSPWPGGQFDFGGKTPSPADLPDGWQRGTGDPAISDPAIAQLVTGSAGTTLGLVDGDQQKQGEWISVQPWTSPAGEGRTMILSWWEAYNVIGGAQNRASYINVPPGRYTFRVIGLAGDKQLAGKMISLPVIIDPPFWQRVWFGPLVTAGSIALVAGAAFGHLRRRSKRRLERLRFQNALEQDRSRIARDMHDDLGTRVTVLNMTAALARRDMEADPAKARRHLDKMTDSARELVEAMDDLVWAVDPAHDTLDHLASHLTRMAEEMFRDTPVRCRLDIPAILPARPLGSDYRHHVALAVKESLHNVLQHAGPCEVFLSVALEDETLAITVRDTGKGFNPAAQPHGHGLDNTAARIREIGGSYALDSSKGHGTCVVMLCRLPEHPN